MRLLFDLLTDAMSDLVVNFGWIFETVLDFFGLFISLWFNDFFRCRTAGSRVPLFDHCTGSVDLELISFLLLYFLLFFLSDYWVLVLLQANFSSKVLQILMRLFQYSHYSTIFLRVNQIYILVNIVIPQSFNPCCLLFINHFLRCYLFFVQVRFDISRDFLYFSLMFFVEFHEVFVMVEYLFQELLSTGAASGILSGAHLLLKSIQSSCFFFRGGEYLCASVKVPVD